MLLKATANLWASWPWVNNFFAVFFCFSVGSYKKALNDWPWLCGKQRVFFSPLNVSQGEVEYWGSQGNKTHHLPWGKSLSAQWLSWFCKNGNLKQTRVIYCILQSSVNQYLKQYPWSTLPAFHWHLGWHSIQWHSIDRLVDGRQLRKRWSSVDEWPSIDRGTNQELV